MNSNNPPTTNYAQRAGAYQGFLSTIAPLIMVDKRFEFLDKYREDLRFKVAKSLEQMISQKEAEIVKYTTTY
jgi:hypothetical protein